MKESKNFIVTVVVVAYAGVQSLINHLLTEAEDGKVPLAALSSGLILERDDEDRLIALNQFGYEVFKSEPG